MRRRQSGFTLIELSIVLVIIGLIVGGVLVGQELIKAAAIRSLLSEEEKIQTAVATFKEKYDCLPGDCKNASSFGFTSVPLGGQTIPVNGDGNGYIGVMDGTAGGNAWPTNVPANEVAMFWEELSQARLIAAPAPASSFYSYISIPASLRQNAWWVGYSAHTAGWTANSNGLGNVLAIVGPSGPCSYWSCSVAFTASLTPEEAQKIDAKVDDGLPDSGNVEATGPSNYIDYGAQAGGGGGTPAPYQCVTTWPPPATYSSSATNSNINCDLIFKFME